MDDRKIPRRNTEGYLDLTPHDALNTMADVDEIDVRHHRIIVTLRNMIDLAGWDLDGRIVLIDKVTGRRYK